VKGSFYSGAIAYNNLPSSLKDVTSVLVFNLKKSIDKLYSKIIWTLGFLDFIYDRLFLEYIR